MAARGEVKKWCYLNPIRCLVVGDLQASIQNSKPSIEVYCYLIPIHISNFLLAPIYIYCHDLWTSPPFL